MANLPTVFDDKIPGPLHHQPREEAWLGEWVSLEEEADIGSDEDPTNNIIPPNNKPDLDEFDDGVRPDSIELPECGESKFEYDVNVVSGIEKWYVNAWFDFNRDGDWDDTFECKGPKGALVVYEWAVQDQMITLGAGYHTLATPGFVSGNSEEYAKMGLWMRTTLSERPAQAPHDGRGPEEGFRFGETEDYYLK